MDQSGHVTQTGDGWATLLRRATVMLTVPSNDPGKQTLGTGFVVAPGIVATCAHVLAASPDRLPPRVDGLLAAVEDGALELETDPAWYFRIGADDVDLALLRIVGGGSGQRAVTPVLLSPELTIGDTLWTYGHPMKARAGQPATFVYQGDTRKSLGSDLALPRGYGVPVGPGYSGSAVINTRTGAVCGMLATSDSEGSAHLVPAAQLLARCPQADADDTAVHEAWLRSLTDAQLAAGGRRFAGPRLREYLRAAVTTAQAHPYSGVLPGVQPPSLSQVYVRQGIHSPDQAGERPAPDSLFRAEHDSLLLGGPGAGKSSLLRMGLIDLAGAWLDNTGDRAVVPVLVPASYLLHAGALEEQIAEAVGADLRGHLRNALPAGYFGRPPMPGVRWLVLLDGVDEIAGAEQRSRVLATVRSHQDGPYRFVVASRPVPERELRQAATIRTYELLPLDEDRLPDLAERWFRAMGLPAPAATARAFMAKIGRTRMGDLARNPLMALILCQLYSDDPGNPLPTGRSGLYEDFVGLFAPPDGDAGTTLQRRVFEVLPRLAVARLGGDTRPTLDLIVTWTADLQPAGTPVRAWRHRVEECLRRNGLITERGGDFVFLHQTLAEFLAARHTAVHDPDRSRAEFRRLFGGPFDRLRNRPPWIVHPTTYDKSYEMFLMAAWSATGTHRAHLAEALHRIAIRGGIHSHYFIASLASEGVLLEPRTVQAAAAGLLRVATDPTADRRLYWGSRVSAATALAELGDPRHGDLLADLATDRTVAATSRVRAARTLATLGDPRGTEQLVAQAGEPQLGADGRVGAAEALSELGDARAPDLAVALVHDTSIDGMYGLIHPRLAAARLLAKLGDPRQADVLAELATDPTVDSEPWQYLEARISAAEKLAKLGDARGADILVAIALDTTVSDIARDTAVWTLGNLGDPHLAEVLADLAADPTYGDNNSIDDYRADAARKLAGLGDPRGAEHLATLAADPDIPAHSRIRIAGSLAALGDARGTEQLAALATSPDVHLGTRVDAAWMLGRRGDPRGVEILLPLSSDADGRYWYAARALADLGHPHGADVLAAMALDPAERGVIVFTNGRLGAARLLKELGDPRAARILATLAKDRTCSRKDRRAAKQELAGLPQDE